MFEQVAASAARIDHANAMSETHIWSKVPMPKSDVSTRLEAHWMAAKFSIASRRRSIRIARRSTRAFKGIA